MSGLVKGILVAGAVASVVSTGMAVAGFLAARRTMRGT